MDRPLLSALDVEQKPVVCVEHEAEFLMTQAVSSITFFKSSLQISVHQAKVKARIAEVVKASPWLLCSWVRIRREHNNQVQMVFPASPSDADVDHIVKIYAAPTPEAGTCHIKT